MPTIKVENMVVDLSKEAAKLLQQEAENDDTATAHIRADEILCELLRKLGYKEVVYEYEKVSKWYS